MPCSRLLAQLPTPTMPTAIFLIREARSFVRGWSAPHILNGRRTVNAAPVERANLLLSEPGREVGGERVIGMNAARLGEQLVLGLRIVGVRHAAVDRTHRRTLLLVEEADALGALLRHDVVDVRGERRMRGTVAVPGHAAFVDRRVRAFGLACPAVDALRGDHGRHRTRPPRSARRLYRRRATDDNQEEGRQGW